jgi:O-6-methylguanine DNA methyltransferase
VSMDSPLRTDSAGMERALAELRVSAPASVLGRTLAAVGLADAYAQVESPIGPIFVAFNDLGVAAVGGTETADAFEARVRADLGRPLHRVDALPTTLSRLVRRRLAGDRRARVPFDLRGRSPFERAVLEKALEIPTGEVRPYAWIAAEIGRPKAVRAVGTALAHNPIPLLIPCHRVVRSDGLIGNYSLGGPTVKRRVLETEGMDVEAYVAEAESGIRLVGSDTTRITCLPTCRHARRVTGRHRVQFGSMAQARRAGYRPCKVCRPVSLAA